MYAKFLDGSISVAPQNYTDENITIINFDRDENLMREYGYKPIIEAKKPDYPYSVSYEEDDSEIKEIVEADLQRAKEQKVFENVNKRNEKLLEGVTYNNILFDSDNEQKINLLAKYSMMSDTDTVVWYGMDNQALLCVKEDLMAIGLLIEQLHSFVWKNNAYIKEQIANAETIEELEAIEIDYTQQNRGMDV